MREFVAFAVVVVVGYIGLIFLFESYCWYVELLYVYQCEGSLVSKSSDENAALIHNHTLA